jgi:hypothetical protein
MNGVSTPNGDAKVRQSVSQFVGHLAACVCLSVCQSVMTDRAADAAQGYGYQTNGGMGATATQQPAPQGGPPSAQGPYNMQVGWWGA